MKKSTIGLLAASGICIISGGILSVAGVASGGRLGIQITPDGIRTAEDMGEMIEESKGIKKAKKLVLDVQGMNVRIAEGEEFRADYRYREQAYEIRQQEKGDTLEITVEDMREVSAVSLLAMDTASYEPGQLDILVPEGTKLECIELNDRGNQSELEDLSVSLLKIREEGFLSLKKIKADEIEISDSDYVQAECREIEGKKMAIQWESGEISIRNSSFGEWKAQMHDGTINGDALKLGNVQIFTEYGNVDIKNLDCDTLKADSENGNLSFRMADMLEHYRMNLYSEYGTIYLDGEETDRESEDEFCRVIDRNPDASKSLEIKAENGEIEVYGK